MVRKLYLNFENIFIVQGLAYFFYKGPSGKYFVLFMGHILIVCYILVFFF